MAIFVDRVVLHVKSGNGGNGCVSVKREKFKPLAGPDGGNGGNGGDVILVGDAQVTTLLSFHRSPHVTAPNGGPGMGDFRAGYDGESRILSVPIGTVVKASDGQVIADITSDGMRVVIGQGGQGGLGNAALASTKRKAPGFALLGTEGFSGDVELELKTLADVALVGYPSAGKSSLIAALSAAKPKIADYPFTTLHPNLGVVQAGDLRYTIADVPGLIEGASEGRGLGLEFLRHVERCSALVHVIDCATLEPGRDPLSDYGVIENELNKYDVPHDSIPLNQRPQVVVLNKIDVPEARDLAWLVRPEFEKLGLSVFEISTVTHEGLRELSFALAALVQQHRDQESTHAVPEVITIKPRAVDAQDFVIRVENTSDGNLFRVIGDKPEKWVQQTDFNNEEAIGYLADRLAKLGVEEALFQHGAIAGATVVIGTENGVVFDWEPTLTSTAELIASPRGTDERLGGSTRRTTKERREQYTEAMEAKEEARQELIREREAGLWNVDEEMGNGNEKA